MDISAFIRELLFGHDCVIVPGFGGFIGNYIPARIDKKSGTFFPPVKQISFNRNLNHNDGLLIGKISGSTGINYGDARSLVEEFVNDIRRKLDKGDKVVFDHIGGFTSNQEGNIQFEPDRSSNYHLDSYGLESFQLLPLEGYDVRTRVTRHIQKDPEKHVSTRKILWRAAVIVPLLAAIVIVPIKTNLFRSKVESTTMNPLVSAEFEQNKLAVDEGAKKVKSDSEEVVSNQTGEQPKDSEISAGPAVDQPKSTDDVIRPVEEKPGNTVNTSRPVAEPPKSAVTVPAVNESNVYYLITGSFKSEENARSQVNTLKSEGFTPEIVVAPNGFYRVCAMSCRDIKIALTKKDSLSARFPSAWITKKI